MKLSPMAIGMALGAVLVLLVSGLFVVRTSVSVPVPPSAPLPVPPPPPLPSTNLQIFFVRGVVKELKAGGKTVVIDHEEIPNYMAKMTMPFKVKDTNQLANLGTNDHIQFRFNVGEYESWIDQVTKTGTATTPVADPNRKNFRLVREVDVLKEGDALPDYPFTNQRGEAFRTAQFKGQALAITFIFTRCPVPDFCPRMSLRFAQTDKQLRALPDGPQNYHLLSLSFDVDYDSPPVLQNYANTVKAQHGADLSRWTFATGKLIDIDDITERFGLAFAREPGTVPFNHTLRTVVIDAAGKVQRVFIGNEWKADALVEELVKAATAKP
ncbi:MAG: SCO family protein [Limisphaerales bacterium]